MRSVALDIPQHAPTRPDLLAEGAPVRPRLTVVVPCYDEEAVLPIISMALEAHLKALIGKGKIAADSHVLFVDDGSRDRTWTLVERFAAGSPIIRGLKLSRNRGHQNALLAGLLAADGDAVVSVDADLQDDLNAIERMVDAHKDGAEIVLGVRGARDSDTWFKRGSARAYYRLLAFAGVESVPDHADFRLIGRRAIEALRAHGEANLYLRALVLQLGFTTAKVFYDRAPRAAGQTHYPLRRMISLALDGVTAFSTKPLRMIGVLGLVISVLAGILSVWALLAALVLGAAVPGWASTVVPIYLISGVQLLCMGVMAEYVGRIYAETKRRPRFVVETTCGGSGGEVASGGAPAVDLHRIAS